MFIGTHFIDYSTLLVTMKSENVEDIKYQVVKHETIS